MPNAHCPVVVNSTRNTTLVSSLEVADNPWTRFKGLMNRRQIETGYGLWIEPCADIHSCFMRFAFDAVFVDKSKVVCHIIEAMPPWRISPWVKGARAVLELPAGAIAKSGTQIGDQLILTPTL